MFDSLDYTEQYMLYTGLLGLVTANSGIGFANADQGQPAYVMGSKGTCPLTPGLNREPFTRHGKT